MSNLDAFQKTDKTNTSSPYHLGNSLALKLERDGLQAPSIVQAKITKLWEPFTISPVMQIQVDSLELGMNGLMVLKLYDHRFGTELRSKHNAPLWSDNVEIQYSEFVRSGEAAKFVERLNSDDDLEDSDPEDPLYIAKTETYLHDYCQDLYKTETEVYRRLKDVQGIDVPTLKASVKVQLSSYPSLSLDKSNTSYLAEDFSQFFVVTGIILEYIDGFPLTNLATYAPRKAWQSICEDAVRIVNVISDRGIRNEDVKTRNFIVRKTSTVTKSRHPEPSLTDSKSAVKESGSSESGSKMWGEEFKVVMIDFAMCEFRQPEQTDEEWRKEKWSQDEEGAVGLIMQDKLKGGFVYTRSMRWWSGRDESYD